MSSSVREREEGEAGAAAKKEHPGAACFVGGEHVVCIASKPLAFFFLLFVFGFFFLLFVSLFRSFSPRKTSKPLPPPLTSSTGPSRDVGRKERKRERGETRLSCNSINRALSSGEGINGARLLVSLFCFRVFFFFVRLKAHPRIITTLTTSPQSPSHAPLYAPLQLLRRRSARGRWAPLAVLRGLEAGRRDRRRPGRGDCAAAMRLVDVVDRILRRSRPRPRLRRGRGGRGALNGSSPSSGELF